MQFEFNMKIDLNVPVYEKLVRTGMHIYIFFGHAI